MSEAPSHLLAVREAERAATDQARVLVDTNRAITRLRKLSRDAISLATKIEGEVEKGLEVLHALERRARAARDELPG